MLKEVETIVETAVDNLNVCLDITWGRKDFGKDGHKGAAMRCETIEAEARKEHAMASHLVLIASNGVMARLYFAPIVVTLL